jgi:hypothetical protein
MAEPVPQVRPALESMQNLRIAETEVAELKDW